MWLRRINHVGGLLGVESFDADTTGYGKLLGWLQAHGLVLVGVEGTGSYGVGLARYLTGAGVAVVEVDRPNRQTRHGRASRIRLTRWRPPGGPVGNRGGDPEGPERSMEAMRVLMIARRSARYHASKPSTSYATWCSLPLKIRRSSRTDTRPVW